MIYKKDKKGQELNLFRASIEKYLMPLLLVYLASSAWHKISTITEISLYLLFVLTAVTVARHKFTLFPHFSFDVILKVFLLWCLVTSVVSLKLDNSLHDWYKHLLVPLFILYLVAALCKTSARIQLVLRVVISSLGVLLLASMLYYYGAQHHPLSERMNVIRQTGMSINNVGIVAAIPFFAGIYFLNQAAGWRSRTGFLIIILIALTATFLSGTRWAIVGMVLPLPLIFYVLKKRVALFLVFMSLIIGYYSPVARVLTPGALTVRVENMERPAIWHLYGLVVADHPLTGLGFGMDNYTPKLYKEYIAKLPKTERFIRHSFYYSHNMFLDLAVRTGIPGMAIFSLLLLFVFRSLFLSVKRLALLRDRKLALTIMMCLLSVVIQALMTNIFLTRYYYILYLLIGLSAALELLLRRQEKEVYLAGSAQ